MTNRKRMAHKLSHYIVQQVNWMNDHGRDLAGYVARYGSQTDPEHYGDGGEAIYAADHAELAKLCRLYRRFSRD